MYQKNQKEWNILNHDTIKKHMRCDFKSSALYKCGKNITKLTSKEKYLLMTVVFKNFYNAGYSKYGYLFSNLFQDTFKNEIDEVGKDIIDKFILRYIINA